MTEQTERERVVFWLQRMADIFTNDLIATPRWRLIRRAALAGRAAAVLAALDFIERGYHLKGTTDD